MTLVEIADAVGDVMKLLPLFLSAFMIFNIQSCAGRKKKNPVPAPTVSPTPPIPPFPPTPPVPPTETPTPPPFPPTPPEPGKPTPTPTPTPSNGQLPPVSLDVDGIPIIPQAPITTTAHVIMTDGSVLVYRGWVSSVICFDSRITAYYKPCPTGLYCWSTPAVSQQQCGYFICNR